MFHQQWARILILDLDRQISRSRARVRVVFGPYIGQYHLYYALVPVIHPARFACTTAFRDLGGPPYDDCSW